MNIRPKEILYADTGVKFSLNNLRGANWRQQVFNNYRLHLLDLLAKYGEADDYGKWLNEMLSRHSNIYNLAGGEKGNWENIAYKNDLVGQYQQDYKGGLGNNGLYKRFGTILLNNSDRYDFNQTGIKTNQSTRYNIANPPTRTSGDYSREGYNYKVDNLYSAITDDRRLLGRKGDWDENSEDFKQWLKDLNSKGWETYLDTTDNYYKLRRLNAPSTQTTTVQTNPATTNSTGSVPAIRSEQNLKGLWWSKLSAGLKNVAPDLIDALRLAGNLHNNERVYNILVAGIRPNLLLSYHTYRQVVGDEATKLAYYRRAAAGQTKAALPFTSDADRLQAYQMEAKRIGDELRALGDLADNQEIRRTSDESNLHQWANVLRDTEVANRNYIELNNANAARLLLLAQKYSADWTSKDNWLMGWQNRFLQKKLKQELIDDQIRLLDMQLLLLTNEDLAELREAADKAYSDLNLSLKEKIEKRNAYLNKLLELRKKAYYNVYTAKEGAKLKTKYDDKYLYKTSRDVVEHFRRMTKMADDSRIKSRTKPIKLSSHPRKMLQGGVAPFTVYRPLGVGGEQAVSTSSGTSNSSSSKKSDAEKDKLDMIKELFKSVLGKGLPIDVESVYKDIQGMLNKASFLGDELSTDDIASMYLSSMNKVNNIMHNKALWESAKQLATSNEALNDYAIGTNGEMVVLDLENDGKLKTIHYSQYMQNKDKFNPLTNNQLLHMREYSPNMAFDDTIFHVVNNGVGINKVTEQILKLAAKLGSSEEKIEGITQVLSNKIKAGLKELAEAPDGYYKVTEGIKNQNSLIAAALKYIENALPKNYKTLLDIHSDGHAREFIAYHLSSEASNSHTIDISPLTGKAAKDTNGSMGEKGGAENSAGLAFVLGLGPRELIDFNTGTSVAVRALGIRGTIQNHSQENLGLGSTLQDVSKSQFSFLKLGQATFGGSRLNPGAYSHIMLNDSEIMGVDLPYKTDLNGNTVPDFLKCKLVEKADEIISQQNITDPNKINEVYLSVGLSPKYNLNGELNTQKYMRFAAIQATLDELALLNKEAVLSDEVLLAGDVERDLYKEAMKKNNKDYDLGDGMWLTGWWKDELYKGTIFIPYDEDVAFAAVSSGRPMKQNLPDNTSTVQLMLYAPKSLNYKPQDVTLSQIINN